MESPNFKDGSIVNLMKSIKNSINSKNNKESKYQELKDLPSKKLKNFDNIILIVIDGLGYNYMKNNYKDTIFEKYLTSSITSVYPPTTGTAIPTFLTGLPPRQSGFVGWYTFYKELGIVSTSLPFKPRVGAKQISGIELNELYPVKSFSENLKSQNFIIQPKQIKDSQITKHLSKNATRVGFSSLAGFSKQIVKVIKSKNNHSKYHKKYIYAYWSDFDKTAHENGVGSKKAKKHFLEIAKEIESLIKRLKGTNTKIILTADHGFIDTKKEERLKLEDHPKLNECLILPFCGDSRTIYCYVKANKAKDFEKYVKTNLHKYCNIYKSEDFVKKGYFGLFESNPKLMDRIGDYILIMKDNYVFKDRLLGEKKKKFIGKHSGSSKNELLVPLVVINTQN